MTLYDYRGRPIDLSKLDDEHVDEEGPWATPVRDSAASFITPKKLASYLRAADEGDVEAYLTLAEEMEERDLHYRSVLFQRRAVISSLTPAVEAVDDSDEQQAIAEAVHADIVRAPQFGDLLFDMMDAVGKGYAIIEILWDTSGTRWRPREYKWRDPRWYRVDPITLRGLRLEDGSPDGSELPPAKYVVHKPKLKSGVPIRSGLARLASIAFVFKNYTIRDLARFLEVYGIPPRIGRYQEGASKEQRRRLMIAARMMGSDAAGIIPKTMDLEVIDSPRGTSAESFIGTAEWWDRQISKGVLGQTSSSDGSAGDYKASTQHQGVRMDLAKHDATQVANSIMRDVVRAYVDFNFGPQDAYPRLMLPVPVPEDLTKFAAAVTPFVDRGLKVSERSIREKLGLTEPDDSDSLLTARVAGPQAPMGDAPGAQDPAS